MHLISLDLTRRLSIRLKPALLKEALARGSVFEVSYGPALRGAVARRNIFCNAQLLSKALYGRGIVLSSAASTAMELRGPYDVANLGPLLGLTQEAAKVGVSRYARDFLFSFLFFAPNSFRSPQHMLSSFAWYCALAGWQRRCFLGQRRGGWDCRQMGPSQSHWPAGPDEAQCQHLTKIAIVGGFKR